MIDCPPAANVGPGHDIGVRIDDGFTDVILRRASGALVIRALHDAGGPCREAGQRRPDQDDVLLERVTTETCREATA